MEAKSPLIIALDYPDAAGALEMAGRLDPGKVRVKVGKELFTAAGPAVVEALVERGFQVFLDLKFHDIPNTVAAALRSAAALGVWMVNVHAAGGPAMLAASAAALRDLPRRPLLVAVTVLTSMDADELAQTGVQGTPEEQVRRLARLARQAGLDGVVCSAREASGLRGEFGRDFSLVTPGIRPAGSDQQDQKRVVTPRDARELGVDYMVVGRPVTGAPDPAAAVDEILQDLSASS